MGKKVKHGTNERAVQSSVLSYDFFIDLTKRAFSFLPRDYSFKNPVAGQHGRDCEVRYESATTRVEVYYESCHYPEMYVQDLSFIGDPLNPCSFNETEMIVLRCPDVLKKARELMAQPTKWPKLVQLYSKILKENFRDCLLGDFAVLQDIVKLRSSSIRSS